MARLSPEPVLRQRPAERKSMEKMKVRVWEETCTIPTYKVFPPEKTPLFLEKRAYQGSTGKVYPMPVTEKISDKKEDVEYRAVYLENEYLLVMLLPELGGRIQRALDKTNNYDFVYYNHVIKPALVGLTGPWISGGIEFNWPQHHRPSTYAPVDYTLEENADGSCTVYMSETDKMYGTKGMAAISLYPGKAYIEIKGQLYNRTDLPQTFLWWANPAVAVNDHTYSVFPPDVNAVLDHGKRAVSTFPIATGEYYKADYSAGVDISRYKNVPVPTSYMAAHSDFDFIGNFDEQADAGLLHVADHHVSPGKKQWTWGNGDFGRTWDKNLTDADGPYIELMTGVFTDNQPDFTWLKPHEEKTFVQYFMPYKGVGRVCNATREAAVSLELQNAESIPDSGSCGGAVPQGEAPYCEASSCEALSGKSPYGKSLNAVLKLYVTGPCPDAEISVTRNGHTIFTDHADLTPERCYEAVFALEESSGCHVSLSCHGRELVSYDVYEKKPQPVPEPAEAMKAPADMKSTEELYLAASHLEQYRHATFEPADYLLEGLRRDPGDIRLNNSYGLLLLRRGHFRESLSYFEAAVARQTWKNPNPYMGECYFNLGLALDFCGEEEKAFDAFYKATWSAETQNTGFYRLACLAARKGRYEEALEFAEKSLIRNWHDMKTRSLKAALLRKIGLAESGSSDVGNHALQDFLKESLAIDPLCMGCLYEQALLDESKAEWKKKMRAEAHNYLELALDYQTPGFYEDALDILEACPEKTPMVFYHQGHQYHLLGREAEAYGAYQKAECLPVDGCFPNRLQELLLLEQATASLSPCPRAHYYLGCLLYDKKQYEAAAAHWETAVAEEPRLAPAWRNLSIYYFNKKKDNQKAITAIQKACEADSAYPRYLLEYDQLAAKTGMSVSLRLAVLEKQPEITAARDDLYLRYITLLNCSGRYQEALDALRSHRFHPWEGGEGKVSAQYRYALVQLARQALTERKAGDALALLQDTLSYPENLGEGKLPNVPDNQAHYLMGLACRMLGDEPKALHYLTLAASGPQEPGLVLYYNDQPSDFIFYQGLACRELGREDGARKAFHILTAFGEKHLFDRVSYDYFAVSLPEIEVYQDDIALRNVQYCNYLRALGSLGLGDAPAARKLYEEILKAQPDYQGAGEILV